MNDPKAAFTKLAQAIQTAESTSLIVADDGTLTECEHFYLIIDERPAVTTWA